MKRSRPRRLTQEEIELLRNSPFVIKKRKEAQEAINSPQYQKHAKERYLKRKQRDESLKLNVKKR